MIRFLMIWEGKKGEKGWLDGEDNYIFYGGGKEIKLNKRNLNIQLVFDSA